MNPSNYYINNKDDLKSNKDSCVIGEKYRFTVLSKGLIRMEYDDKGVFEDRATSNVCFRNFPKVDYSVNDNGNFLEIKTDLFTLNYYKNTLFKSNILNSNLNIINNITKMVWHIDNQNVKNIKGIGYSLDECLVSENKLDNSLYSLDGFFVLDDSFSYVLDNNLFIKRDDGIKDLYIFIYNENFKNCLKDYILLTGNPYFIPKSSLGIWWNKNENYDLNSVTKLVKEFKKDGIPLSNFILNDCWHDENNFYLADDSIKDISKFLKDNNIKLGVTINPLKIIKDGSKEYKLFNKYIDNPKISFIPFTNEKIGLFYEFIINRLKDLGVSIFNIDYNNINDKDSLWKICHYLYGNNYKEENRSVILSRNFNVVNHRYPNIWTGKTKVDWETLNYLPSYMSRGYNSCISFNAFSIGGYVGGIEDDELFIRYVELATFSPIFLLSSEGGKFYKREPWKWNHRIKSKIVYYMRLRYKLIPYLYNLAYIYHITGVGLIKPFYHEYPKMIDSSIYSNQYFLGDNIFVAPITEKKNDIINRSFKSIFFPSGIWFDFFSGKKYIGDKVYLNFYREEDYPVFVKAGSIIPLNNIISESIPSLLELDIYPFDSGKYVLYEDDGFSNNYKNKEYMKTLFEYIYKEDDYTFNISKLEGKNILNTRAYRLVFKNIRNISDIETNISKNNITYYSDKDDFIVELSNILTDTNININIKGKNTIINTASYVDEEIKNILYDLEIKTVLKEKIDNIVFSELPIKKKRIKLRKMKKDGLEKKYIDVFINLLEYLQKI